MSARAPGKVMLAGEYAVLHGRWAAVMAVDRYAEAREIVEPTAALTDAPPSPPEVTAALEQALREQLLARPHRVAIDARDLGRDGRKLGLGSSAAGCVAALGAALVAEGREIEPSREALARTARRGHRVAQGGGSGLDVLASALGGVLAARMATEQDEPELRRLAWPSELHWCVLWTGVPVRTSELLAPVRRLRAEAPERFETAIDAIGQAAEQFLAALEARRAERAVAAFSAHLRAMDALGQAASVPIVTSPMRRLAESIEPLGAALKPSGAGGGDVVLAIAQDPATLATACERGRDFGFVALDLRVDDLGVRAAACKEQA